LLHPKSVSSLEACATGEFNRILPDTQGKPADQVQRIILCTGKIYYELEEHRSETRSDHVAIIRLEQLYPFATELLKSALAAYRDGTPVFWAQEEPINMGAWPYLRVQFGDRLFERFPFAGIARPASASPATGSHRRHQQEQKEIIERAFGNPNEKRPPSPRGRVGVRGTERGY